MCLAGLFYLGAGVFILHEEIIAARGCDKLTTLAPVFIAVSLAIFAPEHFRGPEFIQQMAPSYMPVRWFWPYFIGCALLAAATSLTFRKFLRLSSTLLGLMFFLFVCMIYAHGVLRHPDNRMAWILFLRDLSFCAGAWSLASLYNRASWPQLSKWLVLFGRLVLAIAAIFYGIQNFLHPRLAPGVPLEKVMPSWIPLPSVWTYLAGAILLAAGVALALKRKPRMAAASIGALMAFLTLFPYLAILVRAIGAPAPEFNEAINYVADTLLYAGAALGLAAALPRGLDREART